MPKVEKHKYKITINYYGEIHIYYKWAISITQALVLSVRQLECTTSREKGTLWNRVYFSDSWRVEKLKDEPSRKVRVSEEETEIDCFK